MKLNDSIKELAETLVRFGFKVYIAEKGTYGFYTDETGKRTVSFELRNGMYSFGGNYKPSKHSGTGWTLEAPSILNKKAFEDMLYANAPGWRHNPNPEYTTEEQYIESWPASKYQLYVE